jgi:hypothetical protein
MSIQSQGGMWRVNHAAGFTLAPYQYLTFGLLPTNSDYAYTVQFYDTSGQPVGNAVSIGKNSPYTNHDWGASGSIWTVYCVPLTQFGALPAQVGGVSIQDASGRSTNTFYLSAPGFFY